MGQKNQKGSVTIENADQRIRLRWRYQGKRYSISLGSYSKVNLRAAKKVVLQIELDMANTIIIFEIPSENGVTGVNMTCSSDSMLKHLEQAPTIQG